MTWAPDPTDLAAAWLRLLWPLALEAAVVGVLLWLLARGCRWLPSPVRHGLLLLALIKFLIPAPAAPWAVSLPVPAIASLRLHHVAPLRAAPAPLRDVPQQWAEPTTALASGDTDAGDSLAASRRATTTPALPGGEDSGLPTGWFPATIVVLLLLQLSGALILLGRRMRQLLALARQTRRCEVIEDAAVRRLLRAVGPRRPLRGPPRLLACPDELGPAAAGLWYRRIFIPRALLERLPPAGLRSVLAHEVTHHRRGDLWIDALVFFGSLVWWPHPVYWLLRWELGRAREDCCDEAAVAHARSPRAYCQVLLRTATALQKRRPALVAVAHGGLSHPLERRIRRMMTQGFRPAPQLSRRGTVLLLAVAALVIPGMAAGSSSQPVAGPAPIAIGATGATSPPASAAAPPAGAQRREVHSWGGGVTWSVINGRIGISEGAVDSLVERGIERAFLEQLDGTRDRELTSMQLREWSTHGFDPAVADELEALGIAQLKVSDVLRLVWSDADAPYIRSLREAGLSDLDIGDIARLARYEVSGEYIAGFREQGYATLSPDELVRLHRYEVQPEYAGTYRDAGYELSVDDLVRLNRYEVDQDAVARLSDAGLKEFSVDDMVRLQRYSVGDQYIRAMTHDGDVELSVDDLVRLRRYEVTPEYADRLRQTGTDAGVDDLIRLARYEVDPGMVQQLADLGYSGIAADDLIKLQRYEVSVEYVRGLEALGQTELSIDDLVTLQRYEVPLSTLQALGDSGYSGATVSDAVRLHRYGVGADVIRAFAAASERQFELDDLVTLRRYEIDATYISGLAAVGYGDLPVSDSVRLKRYGVEPSFIERLQQAGFDDLTVDRIIRLKRADR